MISLVSGFRISKPSLNRCCPCKLRSTMALTSSLVFLLIVQSVLVNLAGKWRALHVMGAWLSPKQASECYRGKSNY